MSGCTGHGHYRDDFGDRRRPFPGNNFHNLERALRRRNFAVGRVFLFHSELVQCRDYDFVLWKRCRNAVSLSLREHSKICRGHPLSTILPPSKNTTVSDTSRAHYISCVTITMVMTSSPRPRMPVNNLTNSHGSRLEMTSSNSR